MAPDKALRPSYACTRWVFLRLLGVIYAIAFVSLLPQVLGLIGSNGILPAGSYLDQIASSASGASAQGGSLAARCNWLCFLQNPTLFWFCPSDAFLIFLCAGGLLAGLGVAMSVATAPLLVVAWVFYLSLVNIGQDFLSFQWDALLLEAGFLAIFWADWEVLGAPWRAKPLLEPNSRIFLVGLWLFRWLLFRLMFLSGAVKILSGDVSWRQLTALEYHYFTQPLPTPLAWVANQLPAWLQSISVAGVFFTELVVPFFFFLPRPFRVAGAALTALLQVLIMLTGNYTFFNLLTLALCVLLLDDGIVAPILPPGVRLRLIAEAKDEQQAKPGLRWRGTVRAVSVAMVAVLVMVASLQQLSSIFAGSRMVGSLMSFSECFHVVNSYGLFAVMTTTRSEIDVEGSNDAEHWQPYIFRYKPGPLDRPPPVIEPFQPRLDWQMWFAALGTIDDNPWFLSFVRRLLLGSPDVLSLLENNPFPQHPPKFIRARLYQYQFTNLEQLLSSGRWWKRELCGTYMPVVSFTTHGR